MPPRTSPDARRRTRALLGGALAVAVVAAIAIVVVIERGGTPATVEETVFSPTTTPATRAAADAKPLELGMKFQVKVRGQVLGVRYYRARSNTGTHTGSLWTSSGTRLATVTFPAPTTVGWQTAAFAHPVPVVPHQTYVISYFAPKGHYSDDVNAFRTGLTRGDLVVPRAAGVYVYGSRGGFPTKAWRYSNYHVDVRFAAGDTSPSPSRSILALPRMPWYGGPAYYSKFPRATAAGWTSPSHFPIGVWLGKPRDASALASLGINTYVGAEHDGSPLADITGTGIDVIAQDEWTRAEVGDDPHVVGWQVSDECEQGAGACGGDATDEYQRLADQQKLANKRRALNDGRFLESNWSHGILGTYWATHTFSRFMATVDVSSDDMYPYASPAGAGALQSQDCCWPVGKPPVSAGSYGYMVDRLQHYTDSKQPAWPVIETARPLDTESGARTITPPQIEGAVWNSIIHGASGIIYFQHNNDPSEGGLYSLITGPQELKDKVEAIDTAVENLAPVLNTQSYAWSFSNDTETMLKVYDGYAYVFAMTKDGGSGSRTFTLPAGVAGDVTVIGESRTLPVTNGQFTDSFATEYTHHIYKIKLG